MFTPCDWEPLLSAIASSIIADNTAALNHAIDVYFKANASKPNHYGKAFHSVFTAASHHASLVLNY